MPKGNSQEVSQVNILAVVGSPRKGSNTDILVDKVIEGARSAGATVEKIYLSDLQIGACDVCNSCSKDGCCVKNDGMQQVYAKMLWAGGFIIGTPVYWWGPSAQTKLFIDRWYAFDNKREAFSGKPLVLTSTSGASSPSMADHVFGMFRSIAPYLNMPLIGTLWAPGGSRGRAARDTAAMARAFEMGRRMVNVRHN